MKATAQDLAKALKIFSDILGSEISLDAEQIKSAYRLCAMKCHPDKGGSEKAMQELNWARDVLDQNIKFHTGTMKQKTWQEREREVEINNQKLKVLAESIKTVILKAKDSYLSHFQKYLGNLLQEEISTSSCRDQYGFAKVQWVADDRKTVIALSIHVSLPRAAMLGAHQEQNDNILLSYTTSLFHNDRMYKVAQRSYVGNCLSGELSNPENVYPEKAMLRLVKETRKASKMAARDFHGALGWELMGKCGGSGKVAYAYIPIEGNRFLHLYRSTFLRQSAWSSAGITLKTSDYGYSRSGEIAYVTFAESDEGLAEVKALVAFLRAGGSFSEWASMQKDQRNLNSQRA